MVRQWNDFVSIISAFYLVLTENAIINILVLLPIDVLWVVLQFVWWVIEVIYLEFYFIWEGLELMLRE
jgi:hypothetical protein